jgi:muconolactone delta-isomerase
MGEKYEFAIGEWKFYWRPDIPKDHKNANLFAVRDNGGLLDFPEMTLAKNYEEAKRWVDNYKNSF